jgi:hypothetical protein
MKIPDYGDHMSLDQFNQAVDHMCFIDYDGYGKLATENEMSNIVVVPSEVFTKKKRFRKKYLKKTEGFTHIVWFNK